MTAPIEDSVQAHILDFDSVPRMMSAPKETRDDKGVAAPRHALAPFGDGKTPTESLLYLVPRPCPAL